MNILLTNDDGIQFPGITAVYNAFKEISNPFIFAPAMEKSATSQAMTLFEDIYVRKVSSNIYIVNGYPVDCVNIALHGGLINEKFDLVISGINKGVNMGEDIFYSGTVGAARHAFIHNIPAIAISSGYRDANGDFESVAAFLRTFIESIDIHSIPPFFLNVNYPIDIKYPPQIKWTKSGLRIYRDSYKRNALTENEYLLNLGGSELGYKEMGSSDFEAYNQGYVSITPLNKDGTDHSYRSEQITK